MYNVDSKKVLKQLQTTQKGLSTKEVQKRQKKFGKNIIKKEKTTSIAKLLLSQLKNYIIYILLIAAGVSIALHEYTDAAVILAIVLLNTLLGFFQEYKAEKALAALQAYTKPKALVIRNNIQQEVSSEDLVPGDIIIIEEGTHITADARIITNASLFVDESLLTGESVPVEKNTITLKENTILANRANMLYAGTTATQGRATAVITNTATTTELGKIAKQVQTAPQRQTPLQKKLQKLGIQMTYAILIICTIVFAISLLRGQPINTAILVTIALIVAAVPEGLPAVVTICLALGTQRMVKRKALIRRLPAVETLGSVTAICSDKTGTLTQNKMTVKEIYTKKILIQSIDSIFTVNNKEIDPKRFSKIFEIATLCNNATETTGDPTERALKVIANKAKVKPTHKRIKEIPFNSHNKFMATTHQTKTGKQTYLKGATEVILEKCKAANKKEIIKQAEIMAQKGLRVLALAYTKTAQAKDATFVGLIGMRDPPRPEVPQAIQACKRAGIKVVMITGDHLLTAQAIAQEIGIEGQAITGKELATYSEQKLKNKINNIGIVARVSPAQKVRILQALEHYNHIVAMTGDGVNDAPALKRADIGVAVGTGTDVAKEAADMVLLDDNFATIVGGIEEGRGIFINIKKFIHYLFASNLGELLVIFIGLLIGLPLPVLAIQILWINLVTDGLPALALGVDPPEKDILKNKPRNPKEGIVKINEMKFIALTGVGMCIATLILFNQALNIGTLAYAQTVAFTTLVAVQMTNAINYHALGRHLWQKSKANMYLYAAILGSLLLQVLVVYGMQGIFKTESLTLGNWIGIGLIASAMFILKEIYEFTQKQKVTV